MSRQLTALRFAAMSAALKLKADTLEPGDLDGLLAQAMDLAGTPEAEAIAGFHRQVIDSAGEPAQLRVLADDLFNYIELTTWPEPPGQERADLHG